MPNWCSNRLTVTGPDEDIRAFAQKAEAPKVGDEEGEQVLDFNAFLPMPEEFMGVQEGSTMIGGVQFRHWKEVPDPANPGKTKEVGISEAQLNVWRKKYGAAGWFEWACSNWGTKWNAAKPKTTYTKGTLVYLFQTAWSPMSNDLVDKMASAFPRLKFRLAFGERGAGYVGWTVAENGAITEYESRSLTEADWNEIGEDETEYAHDDEFKDLVESSG